MDRVAPPIQRLRRVVVNVARVQEGDYRMAGLDDLAARLRRTVQGPRSRKAKADTPDNSPKTDTPDDSTTPLVNEA